MKFSIINGVRHEAFINGKGHCEFCLKETIAKCGKKNIFHWAHKNTEHCDSWWENKTQWHRDWQNKFPKNWQEVIHYDAETNEKHIADIKTKDNTIIEFQNSIISLDEVIKRENFFKKIIWVVNGAKFAKRFLVLDKLPNPDCSIFKDIRFIQIKKASRGKLFFNVIESPKYNEPFGMVQLHNIKEIQIDIENNYVGHHQYDWLNPHFVWFEAKCSVFFDFGDRFVYKLIKNYDDRGLKVVQKFDKSDFISLFLNIIRYLE